MAAPSAGPYDPRPMTSLDRYILRQCLSVTLFVTAALSAAVWLAQSLRLVDLIVNRGLSAEVFLYLQVEFDKKLSGMLHGGQVMNGKAQALRRRANRFE